MSDDILNPGFDLTLRPMKYPQFYQMYLNSIKNTWTVDEVDFSEDLKDLRDKITPAERHMIERLVAFFATGDTIVANNIAINLYQHINSPEARMYLSRQIAEEALHSQFYLSLLDNYIPDVNERHEMFKAVDNIPSIMHKANFCKKWMASVPSTLTTEDDKRKFVQNLICYSACVEGLFFWSAFAYVFFLRSKGLFNGLGDGTSWTQRDEEGHMNFAFEVIDIVRSESPYLLDGLDVESIIREAVELEVDFASDLLDFGVIGLSVESMREYIQFVADQRLKALRLQPIYGSKNPYPFMDLQGAMSLTNFFERTPTEYALGVSGEVGFDEAF